MFIYFIMKSNVYSLESRQIQKEGGGGEYVYFKIQLYIF